MQDASVPTTVSLQTSDFGDVHFDSKHVFTFDAGLLGFPELHEFILVSEEATAPFRWLLSVKNPTIGFPLLSPWYVDMEFSPTIEYDLDTSSIFVIVTLLDEQKRMTANMKAPILLNVERQTGEQIILPGDNYSTHHSIESKAPLPLRKNVPSVDNVRTIFTAQFGSIEVADSQIIHFQDGLLGFSNLLNFVIISDEDTAPFKWLVSLEQPSIGFPMLSPWLLDSQYDLRDAFNPAFSSAFVVVTLSHEMTANMKAPVIINVNNQTGEQRILSTDKYSPTFAITNKKL
ncbi:MAG: flagellar assembly protein FliW [Ignavibacteria bacterium]|nr:flagellar assembly protein FliW [Ignavibacteria bacterium]